MHNINWLISLLELVQKKKNQCIAAHKNPAPLTLVREVVSGHIGLPHHSTLVNDDKGVP